MQKKVIQFIALWIGIIGLTYDCLGNLTRNDLISDPIETIHGKLVIMIQNQDGFEHGTKEQNTYNIAIRLDDIPASSEGETLSLQVRVYIEGGSEKLVYESPRFSGEIVRRPKYNDWLVGRDIGINLDFSDYDFVVTMSHAHDQDKYPEILVYSGKVVSKRLEKSGWLDLF